MENQPRLLKAAIEIAQPGESAPINGISHNDRNNSAYCITQVFLRKRKKATTNNCRCPVMKINQLHILPAPQGHGRKINLL